MKINIGNKNIDKDDKKIIQLLESSVDFENRVNAIRKKYSIPDDGLDAEGFYFDRNYLKDDLGRKVKLVKTCPKSGNKGGFDFVDDFLDDPGTIFSKEGEFTREIEKLCSDFNLNKRWYHAVCHIVIFSTVQWLHHVIKGFVQIVTYKSNWKCSGIVIRVTRDIKKKKFIKWLDENWDDLRQRLRKSEADKKKKGLPKAELIEVTKEIIRLREKEGKTPDEIASILTDKYKPEDREYLTCLDAQNIQKRYNRYQKIFGRGKKRHKK